MKKFMPLIVSMGISLFLGVLVGQVTLAEESELQSMVDLVLERHCSTAEKKGEECITNTYKSDHRELKKLAENENTPFNNLYLFTYQNISEAPRDAAIEYLAQTQPKYTKSELEAIIYDNDLSQIWDDPLSSEELEIELAELDRLEEELSAQAEAAAAEAATSGITAEFLGFIAQSEYIDGRRRVLENNDLTGTQTYLLGEYSVLYQAYQAELKFQMENRKLAYQAYASEVFFDNDLSNSANIDILHDLDILNYLMFGEFIVYPDREEGGEVELSSEDITNLFEPIVFSEEIEVTLAEEVDGTSDLDPFVCLEDETLREALDAFEAYVATQADEDDSYSYETDEEDEPSEESEEEEDEAALVREEFDSFVSSLTAQEGDWTRTLPCGEIFCITVNLVKGSWGTTSGSQGEFEESENCIACHLDFIAAATDETLSGGVQPNKVSQNWFEDGTCKDVGNGLNLDFHVYAIPVPIELDPGDDTDDLANTQYETTVNQWVQWSYFNNVNAVGKSAAEFEQEDYLNSLELYGSSVSIQDTLQTLIEIEENKTAELESIIKSADIQVKVESSYNLYSQMAGEFQTMLIYFSNFSDWLKASYSTDDAPLTELLKKPYCP